MSKASERRQERIDHIKGTIAPFKGSFVREMRDSILLSFESLTYASRYAYFISNKFTTHLVVPESARTVPFESRVNVLVVID